MTRRRWSIPLGGAVALAAAALAIGAVAVARHTRAWAEPVVLQSAAETRAPYHLDLGPRTNPDTAAVPSAFDASGKRVLMRVCADPNNMPFSNRAEQGFENKLADLLASDLGLRVEYSWWPQRHGFVRNTLTLGNCDVVMGIAATSGLVLTTKPYYRSTYVFVTRRDRPQVRSFADPALRHMRIGMHLTGGDGADPPASYSLSARGLEANIEGFPIYGDYFEPNPPAKLIDAVASGAVDVGVVWGPLAGYFAPRARVPLTLRPVEPQVDGPVTYSYGIAIGVRHGDTTWRNQLQGALDRHRADVGRLLARYGVPMVSREGM